MSQLITRRRSVTNAPPALSASTALAVSAPLISEPTPFAEATPTASQVPVSSTSSVSVERLNARRPHRRRREPEPSDHTSSESRVESKKNTRGPSRMLKQSQSARQAASKIKIAYDPQHRGVATTQQHSFIASSCGVVIRDNCPFQWKSWAEILEETKRLVRHELSVIYDLEDISPEVMTYLEETLANRYKNWKSTFHTYFKRWDDPKIACLHVPSKLKDRPDDWEWLCKHFTDPKFVKKSVAGQKAYESKTLLHHSGSKPFSYRLQTRRQEGSKFPAIDMFKDVYARPGQEITEQFHSTSILQEATSQLPPETPIEDVTIPEDVGFQIMTDVLDQNIGRRRGKVVRCMGKAQIREMGASSSRSNTAEADALKEEATTLKAQGEQMKEQLKAQSEEMRSYAGAWRDLVQAVQMSGLQISLPAPHLGPPSTSKPPHRADT
ncbi:hypothetical protein D8674_020275 [Pyrus ussuriensis x Pyrus communis]|uniref:Transposase, Ptta/En/Spm, plant n=1 Tax=Pyrus ussuriensis x Pyrus communis TaxID=2448454 RepID=A0A5N5HIK3_9ROSA|nr:hypothetical protein D8674_020275 [Pyrus ussuriensis x Pyrus communis]